MAAIITQILTTPIFDEKVRIGIGRFEIEKDRAIRIKINHDFCKYYLWLIERRFYSITGTTFVNSSKFSTPRSSSHISVILAKIHGFHKKWNSLKIAGRRVEFTYNPENIQYGGSQKKGFRNFWIPVQCAKADELKKELGIEEPKSFLGCHISIANNKNERRK